MAELSFKNKIIIVTGAGGGLGKSYSTFFGSRGAKVLVNDFSKEAADKVVKEINDQGVGEAVANYSDVTKGGEIVKQAMEKWGRVDVLINNAGILRDKSFAAMSEKEWDQIHAVHVKGSYACSKAAWPIMRKQKYGRIIMTASAAGIYGNFGQANYSSAKMGLVSFAKTLAREGAKYNIHANAIAPVAASPMTETIMPPEMLKSLSPDMIVPLVAYLCHDATEENGQLFEGGAGWYGKLRWERSKGVVFKTDDSFTPAAVKARWTEINDFTNPTHPANITDADYLSYLEQAKALSTNKQPSPVRFDNQTVVITGAGGGLGRAYALMYAKLGANVVVNDFSKEAAEKVVEEVKALGARAIAAVCSAEEGEKIVKIAVDMFGALHAVVCNAGILRDKSFAAMTDKEWDDCYNIHVKGTYAVCKAAWPVFRKQKYGRIVNTASSVGVHGNFGQANYSTAKSAIIGLTKTLAIEGKKYNILANCLVPNAGTNMTRTIWPEEMVQAFSPSFVAPIVGYLTSDSNETTQGLYEVSAGWCASYRWQRSYGFAFPVNKKVSPEQVKEKWEVITRFDDKATNPSSTAESLESIVENFSNEGDSSSSSSGDSNPYADSSDPEIVAKAKKEAIETGEYTYSERDVALYNLGIGATEKELDLVFEGDSDFQAVPTFGVIPQFAVSSGLPLDWLPNFSPMMLLHGEQFLSIKAPIPTSGTLVSDARFSEVLDKGKAAAVTSITTTRNKETGEVVFENQSTVFIRGAGGFGGKKTGGDRGAATAVNKPPSRKPDHVVEEKTVPTQAAIYRLSGDYNPLHVDPNFAKVGGFDQPILHGLCFFGISGKHIFRKYGAFKDIKVRFVGSVYPGETVVTEMWKEGDKVIFVTKCKERGTTVLGAAAATLA
ncbi:putative multifunctional beta-oxidation protein [Leucosporidium creatinivorum]|uniref:Putative multifunctional beta-oxidation protein n=1 Tax=Leucosporidium creatinivorum TaxID=106004 RepID=A0A1Y2FVJ7_9BASI|nr:putative multifunctional beta-oxidation protein [Leucosporidium creatinivorum]